VTTPRANSDLLAPQEPEPVETLPRPEPEAAHEPAVEATPMPKRPAPKLRSEFGRLTVKPLELLRRYDTDQSKGLTIEEVERLLGELGMALSPDLVVAQMDPNDSGQLEGQELFTLAWMASEHGPKPEPPAPPPEVAPPLAEVVPASPEASPPSTVIPGTHFARLDADNDGTIDEADLRKLQSPTILDVRLRAVLSALDRDGDGRLSPAEFEASMSDRPR
jgi:Ca2+-binding EF-hand superfamily protein